MECLEVMAEKRERKHSQAGRRMREARERLGLTLEEVGNRLDVNPHTVWYWEVGRSLPNPKHLFALAALYNIPARAILGDDGDSLAAESTGVYRERSGSPADNLHSEIDLEALTMVIEEIERWLALHDRVLSPAKKAEVVVLLYEVSKRAPLESETVGRILRLAV